MIALIVNPHAGGGRAAKSLPRVQERLRALGVERDHALALVRRAYSD